MAANLIRNTFNETTRLLKISAHGFALLRQVSIETLGDQQKSFNRLGKGSQTLLALTIEPNLDIQLFFLILAKWQIIYR